MGENIKEFTPDWAEKIGADGYGENAGEAVNLVRRLVK